jgi:hypothetical protein
MTITPTNYAIQFDSGDQVGILKASADLSATNFKFVVISGDMTVADAGAGEEAIGIRANSPASGEGVDIVEGRITYLTLGNTVAAGDKLKADANGAGIKADTDKDWYGAKALIAGVATDVIPVLECKGFISK